MSKHYVQTTLQSAYDPTKQVTLRLSVVTKLPTAYTPLRKEDIATDLHIKNLQLADPEFGRPLDVLIGSLDCCKCLQGSFTYHSGLDIPVSPTIFGWTVTGPMDYQPPTQVLKLQIKEDPLQQSLQRLWDLDKTPESPMLKPAEEATLYHFNDTHQVEAGGWYKVQLPTIPNPPDLGNPDISPLRDSSKTSVHWRSKENSWSLTRPCSSTSNSTMLNRCPKQNSPWLRITICRRTECLRKHPRPPRFGQCSMLQPVPATGVSLNDTLQTRPNLYPLLSDILIRFRQYRIGFSQASSHGRTQPSYSAGWENFPPRWRLLSHIEIAAIQELVPIENWRHVPTQDNPADLFSWGVPASKLISLKLWWQGPPWLPQWPTQQLLVPRTLPETKTTITIATVATPPDFELWDRYSSFEHLTQVLARVRHFINNARSPRESRIISRHLTSKEAISTKKYLLRRAQEESFAEAFQACLRGKQLPKAHTLSKLTLSIDSDYLLNVSGRVWDKKDSKTPERFIPLSLKSKLTQLLVSTLHKTYQHPGITTLLSIIGDRYYIPGLRSYLKKLSRQCPTCQRAYSHSLNRWDYYLKPGRHLLLCSIIRE